MFLLVCEKWCVQELFAVFDSILVPVPVLCDSLYCSTGIHSCTFLCRDPPLRGHVLMAYSVPVHPLSSRTTQEMHEREFVVTGEFEWASHLCHFKRSN